VTGTPARGDATSDESLFEALRAWRLEQAKQQGLPPYCIFWDSHFRAIVARQPCSLEELRHVKGVSPIKLEKYGRAVIDIVNRHVGKKGK
jgi:ATP-dependent DNA helicase RecQ